MEGNGVISSAGALCGGMVRGRYRLCLLTAGRGGGMARGRHGWTVCLSSCYFNRQVIPGETMSKYGFSIFTPAFSFLAFSGSRARNEWLFFF